MKLSHSLRLRITAAVLLLTLLILGAALHTLALVREQRTLDILLHASGQLQLTLQTLEKQSLNYLENAPRDYPTYYRDVKLYYEDLKAHVATFDMFTNAFMMQSFGPEMTGLEEPLYPDLDEVTMRLVHSVEETWTRYRNELMTKLGEDPEEPRLEWAAEFVATSSDGLEAATNELALSVRTTAHARSEQITTVNALLLAFYLLISLAVLWWFFRRLIRPLSFTTEAFQRVSQGDFGHQIPVHGNDEIASLTRSFNRLSERINALFELTTRIQRGSDLDDTLRFIAETFPRLMPLDWIGILFEDASGHMRVERAYSPRQSSAETARLFPRDSALLTTALASEGALHRTLDSADQNRDPDPFAAWLQARGVRDVLLLPVKEQTPQPGLLVFATRIAEGYTPEHIELMSNIGLMLSLSFARTVQLAERTRLAAIGEFTTGIVHELRTPLATIALALEYFRDADLTPAARRRIELAAVEADRMGRLLADIQEYARPLSLDIRPLDLADLVRTTLAEHGEVLDPEGQVRLELGDRPLPVSCDADRLTQVVLNLTRNAIEAAPDAGTVRWQGESDGIWTLLTVHNPGPALASEHLERLFQPFFTTKPGGTGLGLSIVKRIIDAHGGDIEVDSGEHGTEFRVRLPAIASDHVTGS